MSRSDFMLRLSRELAARGCHHASRVANYNKPPDVLCQLAHHISESGHTHDTAVLTAELLDNILRDTTFRR